MKNKEGCYLLVISHKKAADCSAALVMIVVLVSGHDVTFSSRHLFSWFRLFWPHPSSLDRPFWFHLFSCRHHLFSCRHPFSSRLFSWRHRHSSSWRLQTSS